MTHPLRAAVEARDLKAVSALLAPGVVFLSPVAFQPFRGREAVTEVLAHVLEVLEDFTYVDELSSAESHALIFTATVGGRTVQGLDHLRFDADGLVSEFTVMVRPLSGLIALAEAMAPRVAQISKDDRKVE
jgi:hypothetical protein